MGCIIKNNKITIYKQDYINYQLINNIDLDNMLSYDKTIYNKNIKKLNNLLNKNVKNKTDVILSDTNNNNENNINSYYNYLSNNIKSNKLNILKINLNSLNQQIIPINKSVFSMPCYKSIEDDYNIIITIYESDYTKIFKVLHKEFKYEKVIKSFEIEDELLDEYHLNELNQLRALDHPNIIKIHSCYLELNKCSFVMNYISGGCLFDAVNLLKPLSDNSYIFIIYQLINILSYLRKTNILHLNITSKNILACNSSGRKHNLIHNQLKYLTKEIDIYPVLIDFKRSVVLDNLIINNHNNTILDSNKDNNICNKSLKINLDNYVFSEYTPPEVIRSNIYNFKSEIYSMGVVIFKILTGYKYYYNIDLNIINKDKNKNNESLYWKKILFKMYKNNKVNPIKLNNYVENTLLSKHKNQIKTNIKTNKNTMSTNFEIGVKYLDLEYQHLLLSMLNEDPNKRLDLESLYDLDIFKKNKLQDMIGVKDINGFNNINNNCSNSYKANIDLFENNNYNDNLYINKPVFYAKKELNNNLTAFVVKAKSNNYNINNNSNNILSKKEHFLFRNTNKSIFNNIKSKLIALPKSYNNNKYQCIYNKLYINVINFLVLNLSKLEDNLNIFLAFQIINSNTRNSLITLNEFKEGLMNFNILFKMSEDYTILFNIIDLNKDGFISYNEFLVTLIDKNTILNHKNLKYCYNYITGNNQFELLNELNVSKFLNIKNLCNFELYNEFNSLKAERINLNNNTFLDNNYNINNNNCNIQKFNIHRNMKQIKEYKMSYIIYELLNEIFINRKSIYKDQIDCNIDESFKSYDNSGCLNKSSSSSSIKSVNNCKNKYNFIEDSCIKYTQNDTFKVIQDNEYKNNNNSNNNNNNSNNNNNNKSKYYYNVNEQTFINTILAIYKLESEFYNKYNFLKNNLSNASLNNFNQEELS